MARYGLDRAQYETMTAVYRRDGCPICGDRATRGVVDHQHGTKRARGMICDRCNRGLGVFRDSADVLAAAARYVTRGDWRLGEPRLEPATPTLQCDGQAQSTANIVTGQP
jgi:hypothetical protein